MPHSELSTAAWVTRVFNRHLDGGPTEGELLAQFVRNQDQSAFEELCRRMGPMVLKVCRRIIRDEHAAEDAFQVSFLVLACKAASIRPAESVRGWMYGVATRTAMGDRRATARRRANEHAVPVLPDRNNALPEPTDPDALRVLTEEIANLPEKHRTAVVLCELEMVDRTVAADRLGIPEGTLSSRLGRARRSLHKRLRKRGVTLPVGGLLTASLHDAAASPLLVSSTSTAACLFASGKATAAVLVSPQVIALTRGVLNAMRVYKIKTTAAVVLTALACVGGAMVASSSPPVPSAAAANGETDKGLPAQIRAMNDQIEKLNARIRQIEKEAAVTKPTLLKQPAWFANKGPASKDWAGFGGDRQKAAWEAFPAKFLAYTSETVRYTDEVGKPVRFREPPVVITSLGRHEKPGSTDCYSLSIDTTEVGRESLRMKISSFSAGPVGNVEIIWWVYGVVDAPR